MEDISTKKQISNYLKELEVNMDVDEFIYNISNIYHHFEADSYDQRQIGVFDKNILFKTSIRAIESELPGKFQALDFGCGTGFASLELLNYYGNQIDKLVCFDLSQDMLDKCKEKVDRNFPDVDVDYLCGLSEISVIHEYSFDLVITNAVLHHLVDLDRHFKLMDSVLKSSGFYIIGHEPNNSFYNNKKLLCYTKKFQLFKRIIQKISLNYLLQKFNTRAHNTSIEAQTNNALLEQGLIKKKIPASKIRKLVDIHVPHGIDREQPWGFLGFSPEIIQKTFLPNYQLTGYITHTHIKDNTVLKYKYWRKLEKKLAQKYPKDGAIAIMTFQKQ